MAQQQIQTLNIANTTNNTAITCVNPNTAGNASCKVCGSQNHMTKHCPVHP